MRQMVPPMLHADYRQVFVTSMRDDSPINGYDRVKQRFDKSSGVTGHWEGRCEPKPPKRLLEAISEVLAKHGRMT
jgi:hypothetical protein